MTHHPRVLDLAEQPHPLALPIKSAKKESPHNIITSLSTSITMPAAHLKWKVAVLMAMFPAAAKGDSKASKVIVICIST